VDKSNAEGSKYQNVYVHKISFCQPPAFTVPGILFFVKATVSSESLIECLRPYLYRLSGFCHYFLSSASSSQPNSPEKSWLSTEETKLFNISKQDPMIEKWIDYRTLK